MNHSMKTYVLMVFSAGLGAAASYFALRKTHKKELEEVQEFYREFYEKLYEAKIAAMTPTDTPSECNENEEEVNEPVKSEPIDISSDIAGSRKPDEVESIYTIDPEQYGDREEYGWSKERYVYYAESECFVDPDTDTVVDEDDIMEATDDMAADHFGDFEDDAAYFRNELTRTDIAIYLNPGSYDE